MTRLLELALCVCAVNIRMTQWYTWVVGRARGDCVKSYALGTSSFYTNSPMYIGPTALSVLLERSIPTWSSNWQRIWVKSADFKEATDYHNRTVTTVSHPSGTFYFTHYLSIQNTVGVHSCQGPSFPIILLFKRGSNRLAFPAFLLWGPIYPTLKRYEDSSVSFSLFL